MYWLVFLAITYLCSNWSDQVLTNSIAHGWTPVVNISDKLGTRESPKRVYTLSSAVSTEVYQFVTRGRLVDFIVRILTLSSQLSRLHKLLHKKTTGQILQRLEKPIQFMFCHVTRNPFIVSSTNLYFNFELFVPHLGLTWKQKLKYKLVEKQRGDSSWRGRKSTG